MATLMTFQTALFLAGVALLLVASFMAVLWILAKRIRAWKEQILHAVSIVASNNAHAPETIGKSMAALGVKRAALPNDVFTLREQRDIRALVRQHAVDERPAERRKAVSRYDELRCFLNSLDHPNDAARSYLAIHLHRAARTLDLVPPPYQTSRALELGAYMQMTPALQCVLGYEEVRGGYLGALGTQVIRTATSANKEIFSCAVDLFNAETDTFPYPNEYFDVVLACEIIEHLLWDPAHMLLECSRVLAPGGALVLTTPNVASCTSVGRVLQGDANPQVYSHYPSVHTETPHVREYTPAELQNLLNCCGFQIEYLFTEPIPSENGNEWILTILRHLGFPTDFRGEQTYCVARKCAGAEITRRPKFLYE